MAKNRGTATSNKMMQNMDTYGGQNKPGYHPPTGSAGGAAKGAFSHNSNPMTVPTKGSQIGPGYGNSDRMKAMSNQAEELRKESLRGQAC